MQGLITKQNAQINNNFLYSLWFWKKKIKQETKIKKKKHFRDVGVLWKVISSIAKITKNQVKHLQILHSGVARIFLKFAGKEVCALNILLAK